MYLPDYKGGSIVNLMSSIGNALGAEMPYENLKLLSPEELKGSKNIVLMVIDGLGFEYLLQKQGSFLKENIRGKITSVFPPTTAAAISTFQTGLAPQQHGFTAWFMFLKEIGILSQILRFKARMGGEIFSENGVNINDIFGQESFTKKIKAKSVVIQIDKVAHSDFSKACSKKAKIEPYKDLNGFFKKIKKAVKSHGKKYIYSYWPGIDTLSHKFGVGSKKHEKHFKELDKKIKKLVKAIKNTNTTLIITADHGLLNTPPEKRIWLKDHPKFVECLTMPKSGEGRLGYFYVHPSKTKDFEEYVKSHFEKYCTLYKSEELIKINAFGLGKQNEKLFDRVGDYILVMKDNYVMADTILGEDENKHIGHHGGVSKEEMFVPLIVIKC